MFECKCNKIPVECQVISYRGKKTGKKARHHSLTTTVASSFELLIYVCASRSEVLCCDFLTKSVYMNNMIQCSATFAVTSNSFEMCNAKAIND